MLAEALDSWPYCVHNQKAEREMNADVQMFLFIFSPEPQPMEQAHADHALDTVCTFLAIGTICPQITLRRTLFLKE